MYKCVVNLVVFKNELVKGTVRDSLVSLSAAVHEMKWIIYMRTKNNSPAHTNQLAEDSWTRRLADLQETDCLEESLEQPPVMPLYASCRH